MTCSLVFCPAGNVNVPKAFATVGQFGVNELQVVQDLQEGNNEATLQEKYYYSFKIFYFSSNSLEKNTSGVSEYQMPMYLKKTPKHKCTTLNA